MSFFSKKETPKQDMHSKEYEELIKRVINVEQRVNGLEIENETLRNKVLRKIQFKKEVEEEEEKHELVSDSLPKAKNLNRFTPFGL